LRDSLLPKPPRCSLHRGGILFLKSRKRLPSALFAPRSGIASRDDWRNHWVVAQKRMEFLPKTGRWCAKKMNQNHAFWFTRKSYSALLF